MTIAEKQPRPIHYLCKECFQTPRAHPLPTSLALSSSHFRAKGTLRQKSNGALYLEVPPEFTNSLLPYLHRNLKLAPDSLLLLQANIGVHVPVISAREAAFNYLGPLQEIGTEYPFTIEGLYSWGVNEIYFFKLKSTELEQMRSQKHLSAHPPEYGFYLAIAIQPRTSFATHSSHLWKINPSLLSA